MIGPLAHAWQRVPRWFLAIADQGLVAVLNLSLAIAVAQTAGLSTLGRFTIVTTTTTLCMGVARLLVTDPWLASRTAPKTPGPELRWLVLLAAVGAALITGAVVFLTCGGQSRWLIAVPIAAAVVIQDFGRYLSFRAERAADAFASDTGVLLGAAVAFLVAFALDRTGLTAVLLTWLVGLAVGILVIGRRLVGPIGPRGAAAFWHRFCRGLAARLGLDTAGYMLGVSGSLYLLAYLGSQSDVGLVRIVQTMFSPVALVVTGLTIWLVPFLANRSPGHAALVRTKASVWLAVAGLPLILLAVALGPWVAHFVFGVTEAPSYAAFALAGISTAAMAMAAPWVAGARVSGHYYPIASARAVAALGTVAAIALVPVFRGATGYLGLLALQNVTVAVTAVLTVRHSERQAASRTATTASAPSET